MVLDSLSIIAGTSRQIFFPLRYVQMKVRNASSTRFYKMYEFPIAFYTRVDCSEPIEKQIALF